MSDRDALTPRVYLVRHGETEWAKHGRFTGTTEMELTEAGVAQVSLTAATLVGPGKLLDLCRLKHVFVSPRERAKQTLKLLLPSSDKVTNITTFTEDITEWRYGYYEGLRDCEIRQLRKDKGLDSSMEWNIWTDGCEGGESPQQVTERLDKLISKIKLIQKPYMYGQKPADILIVAHGLILRCFAKRWLGWTVGDHLPMTFSPGGIAVLGYNDNDVDKPTLYLGVALGISRGCSCAGAQ